MKDLIDCINSKVKEKKRQEDEIERKEKQKRKQLEKKLSEFNNYFKKLPYGEYPFSNGEYAIVIQNPFTIGYAKEIRIGKKAINNLGKVFYGLGWGPMDEEFVKYLCDNKENILREIAKQYGCL